MIILYEKLITKIRILLTFSLKEKLPNVAIPIITEIYIIKIDVKKDKEHAKMKLDS